MINVYNKDTGELLGSISEEQLQFLQEQFEEESLEDADYAITAMTIDYLAEFNADEELLELLRKGLGEKDNITVLWSRQ